MQILDNINTLWGDDLKNELKPGAKLKMAASCFSIYAFEALKKELEKIDLLEFIFTAPAFVPNEVTDKVSKERREFYIPKQQRERSLYGSEFEIHLKNKLTQRAIAKECANWIRRKARFCSNSTKAPMQQFACVSKGEATVAYMPLQGFTAVDLGYQQGDAVSNFITKFDDASSTQTWLTLFNQIWNDTSKIKDVTDGICAHIESVYQENSPEKIYFLMLYNIFNEFLEDLNEDVLPNDLTGYQNSVVWNKLFNFQRDAATGIINKLESYNGCILADSVGLGKTFTALAVIKYYELRNRSVLVLCPKKLADNWLNYNERVGLKPGVIFTLKNRNSGLNINQHNRLHPYYLIYISDDGQVIIDHTQVKPLLDLVRAGCKGRDLPITSLCTTFNAETQDGKDMLKYSDLLGQAIRTMIEVKEDKDIDSLFSGTTTTALEETIHGLDDFELICFLVVKEENV